MHDLSSGDTRIFQEMVIRRVKCRSCRGVKQELDFVANNQFNIKLFAVYIVERYQSWTVSDVAKKVRLDWKTVPERNKEYMLDQLRRARKPRPKVIAAAGTNSRKSCSTPCHLNHGNFNGPLHALTVRSHEQKVDFIEVQIAQQRVSGRFVDDHNHDGILR